MRLIRWLFRKEKADALSRPAKKKKRMGRGGKARMSPRLMLDPSPNPPGGGGGRKSAGI